MSLPDPLQRPKEDYAATINCIKSDSNVGIDAQYTHAIIIEYLRQLGERIERLESMLNNRS